MSKLIGLAVAGLGVAAYYVYDKYVDKSKISDVKESVKNVFKSEPKQSDVEYVDNAIETDTSKIKVVSILSDVHFSSYLMAKYVQQRITEVAEDSGVVTELDIYDILSDAIEYDQDGTIMSNIPYRMIDYGYNYMDICNLVVRTDEDKYYIEGLPLARDLKQSRSDNDQILPTAFSQYLEIPSRSLAYHIAGEAIKTFETKRYLTVNDVYRMIHGNGSKYFKAPDNYGWDCIDDIAPHNLAYDNDKLGDTWFITKEPPHYITEV